MQVSNWQCRFLISWSFAIYPYSRFNLVSTRTAFHSTGKIIAAKVHRILFRRESSRMELRQINTNKTKQQIDTNSMGRLLSSTAKRTRRTMTLKIQSAVPFCMPSNWSIFLLRFPRFTCAHENYTSFCRPWKLPNKSHRVKASLQLVLAFFPHQCPHLHLFATLGVSLPIQRDAGLWAKPLRCNCIHQAPVTAGFYSVSYVWAFDGHTKP